MDELTISAFFENNQWIIDGIILLLIAAFFIWIVFAKNTKGKLYSSNFGIIFAILLLIKFACAVVIYLKSVHDQYESVLSQGNMTAVEFSLVDMQANTLSISALVVTLASIIITILTLYKEKKAQYANALIKESLNKLNDAEEAIKALTNIVSIQFFGEKNQEYYFDAIQQYIDDNQGKPEDPFGIHFRIAQISIISRSLHSQVIDESIESKFDQVLHIADEIINNRSTTELNRQFAYLEALYVLYRKINFKIQKSPASASDDIKKAEKYLNKISRLGPV